MPSRPRMLISLAAGLAALALIPIIACMAGLWLQGGFLGDTARW